MRQNQYLTVHVFRDRELRVRVKNELHLHKNRAQIRPASLCPGSGDTGNVHQALSRLRHADSFSSLTSTRCKD